MQGGGTPLVKFLPDACNQQVHHTTLQATKFPHPIRSKQKCMHGGGGGGGGHLKRVWDIINKLSHYERLDKTVPPQSRHFLSQSESAPTSAL